MNSGGIGNSSTVIYGGGAGEGVNGMLQRKPYPAGRAVPPNGQFPRTGSSKKRDFSTPLFLMVPTAGNYRPRPLALAMAAALTFVFSAGSTK